MALSVPVRVTVAVPLPPTVTPAPAALIAPLVTESVARTLALPASMSPTERPVPARFSAVCSVAA